MERCTEILATSDSCGFSAVGRLLIFASLALLAGGCTLPLDVVGGLVGPVQTALAAGKLHSAEMASFDEAILAAHLAADDLGLHAMTGPEGRHGNDPTVLQMMFLDDKRKRLAVHLEKRAKTLALIDIDVGFFGSEPVARLYLERVRRHLKAPP